MLTLVWFPLPASWVGGGGGGGVLVWAALLSVCVRQMEALFQGLFVQKWVGLDIAFYLCLVLHGLSHITKQGNVFGHMFLI